jgi:hypothetical protein
MLLLLLLLLLLWTAKTNSIPRPRIESFIFFLDAHSFEEFGSADTMIVRHTCARHGKLPSFLVVNGILLNFLQAAAHSMLRASTLHLDSMPRRQAYQKHQKCWLQSKSKHKNSRTARKSFELKYTRKYLSDCPPHLTYPSKPLPLQISLPLRR